MIELYRSKACPISDDLEEHLRALVVAHRVIMVEEGHQGEKQQYAQLPALKEGKSTYSTAAQINNFLHELDLEVRITRTYQSDACFIDPEDGQTCL